MSCHIRTFGHNKTTCHSCIADTWYFSGIIFSHFHHYCTITTTEVTGKVTIEWWFTCNDLDDFPMWHKLLPCFQFIAHSFEGRTSWMNEGISSLRWNIVHFVWTQPSKLRCCVYNSENWGNFSWSMIIYISSTSTISEYGIKTPSPMPIMEDTATYIPLQVMAAK